MRIVNATRAELSKLLTTRLWWILIIVLFVYVAFVAGILGGVFGAFANSDPVEGAPPPVAPGDLHLIVYSTATGIGYVFPLLLGALATTSEFRHLTLTPTFLANPRRGQVLVAKAVALALVGAVYGVIALLGSIGGGGAVLAITGQDLQLGDSNTWILASRVVLAMALWAVVGVALGALIPNQVAVLVIVLAFTQFLEPILRSLSFLAEWTAQVGQFLPGAAGDALVGWSPYTAFGGGGGSVQALEWWQGGLVLFGIAVIAGVAGYLTTWKRDVT
jgi:ABC-2 type transport system permease protein